MMYGYMEYGLILKILGWLAHSRAEDCIVQLSVTQHEALAGSQAAPQAPPGMLTSQLQQLQPWGQDEAADLGCY